MHEMESSLELWYLLETVEYVHFLTSVNDVGNLHDLSPFGQRFYLFGRKYIQMVIVFKL